LAELHGQIRETLAPICARHEIIFVDDGSTDGGDALLRALLADDPNLRLIRFTRNFGKAAALSAGLRHARHDVVITMDADLQDDPSEIPRFLAKLAEGNDYVSGWKQRRDDPLSKTLPSHVFNKMTSYLFGIEIHDINCGFKAYSRRAAAHLNLYGEMHRFTPAMLHAAGFSGTEIVVKHHARAFGRSKYGVERLFKGLLDMVTVKMMTRYNARPLHFFAMVGLPIFLLGGAMIAYLSALWLLDMGPIGDRPLLLIGILLVVTGTQLIGIGLLAELVQAVGLQERDKYVIDADEGDAPTERARS
jgi:glycosyltransferase involved in cell wall biosynthesis